MYRSAHHVPPLRLKHCTGVRAWVSTNLMSSTSVVLFQSNFYLILIPTFCPANLSQKRIAVIFGY